jgi:hypothetical protein
MTPAPDRQSHAKISRRYDQRNRSLETLSAQLRRKINILSQAEKEIWNIDIVKQRFVTFLMCRADNFTVRHGHSRLDSRAGCEFVVSAPKLCFFVLAVAVINAVSQTSSEENNQLPSQAKQVHGVAVPVPKEIFRSLDQFRDANWSAVKRPEVARWKSRGDQAQIATLLGVVIAEGFIAMEAEDSTEVKNLGSTVLALARGLGVEKRAIRRSRSIIELADKGEWTAARQEWDGVLSDLESGMIELKSAQLAQLVSVGGWLRGTEALSALVLQKYSPERTELLRQPVLVSYLEKQLLAMSSDFQAAPIVGKLLDGIRKIRSLVESENRPLPKETVREVHRICDELVPLSSRRLD